MTLQLNWTAAVAPRDGFGRRVIRSIRAVFATLARRRKIRMTRHRLQELPDWVLRDIGLHRSEIDLLVAVYDTALQTDQNSRISIADGRRS